jgi:hypothetical protein
LVNTLNLNSEKVNYEALDTIYEQALEVLFRLNDINREEVNRGAQDERKLNQIEQIIIVGLLGYNKGMVDRDDEETLYRVSVQMLCRINGFASQGSSNRGIYESQRVILEDLRNFRLSLSDAQAISGKLEETAKKLGGESFDYTVKRLPWIGTNIEGVASHITFNNVFFLESDLMIMPEYLGYEEMNAYAKNAYEQEGLKVITVEATKPAKHNGAIRCTTNRIGVSLKKKIRRG